MRPPVVVQLHNGTPTGPRIAGCSTRRTELCLNLGDTAWSGGVGFSGTGCDAVGECDASMTRGNWFAPFRLRHVLAAA